MIINENFQKKNFKFHFSISQRKHVRFLISLRISKFNQNQVVVVFFIASRNYFSRSMAPHDFKNSKKNPKKPHF